MERFSVGEICSADGKNISSTILITGQQMLIPKEFRPKLRRLRE